MRKRNRGSKNLTAVKPMPVVKVIIPLINKKVVVAALTVGAGLDCSNVAEVWF